MTVVDTNPLIEAGNGQGNIDQVGLITSHLVHARSLMANPATEKYRPESEASERGATESHRVCYAGPECGPLPSD
jgi:hypothetical protein